ncbi:alpha-galactosidase [Candidatus Enterococcus murrayae]|uniref:Alpha-galactosidase n=1 Tax=Candidatus Enterococcus murrayae TaxID=2815321 RepID=A0ABS3HGL7_9ENTE|nr:alpha-galactosidase [Enterococcus sp. MJM16]MBO0452423.1 alpha-galactosidase [Enterococcus sp. MJM16]
MPILFDSEKEIFHLSNSAISYVMGIEKEKYITHRYFGRTLPFYSGSNALLQIDRGFATNPDKADRRFSLNSLLMETSTQGTGDHRISNYQIRRSNGTTVTNFVYHTHSIFTGKPSLKGLPSLRAAIAETLEIVLIDEIQKLEMILSYTLFEEYPVITRSVRFVNHSEDTVFLENAGSMMIDFPRSDFDMVTLNGSHTNEANISRQSLHTGVQKIESTRGTSSPQHQPFLALVDAKTDEFQGEVYAFHLVYSGNFTAQVEVEQYGSSRVQIGIQPETFEWCLGPSEDFQTPEVVINYSTSGLNGMSQTFHHLYQNHLAPAPWQKQERSILLNTWEANYFDFHEADLLKQADLAKETGIELFVLDDGWFGQRNDDTTSLGDWFENQEKLPQGIVGLAEKIHRKGLTFGLWFEPEMISENSRLFEAHPEWALQVPDYPLTEGRRQFVLDLSQAAVQEYLIAVLSKYLSTGKIDYIKWDMNRHLTEVGSLAYPAEQQKEISHRYVLRLYQVLDTITKCFPNCLFENCSSGGGRFDPGMMYYMAQTWTSDNTDALCRSKIQYGYSLLYPPIMMGAHVSPVPNHQVGRKTSLHTRGLIAMSGNFGYELDLTSLANTERIEIMEQINFYKAHRRLLQFGKFYRLRSADEYFTSAWLIKNDTEAMIFYFNGLARPAVPVNYLKTRYLDDQAAYKNTETGEIVSGAELNDAGIAIPRIKEDFSTLLFHWKKV